MQLGPEARFPNKIIFGQNVERKYGRLKIDLEIPRLCTLCKDCQEKLGDLSDYRGRGLQRAGIDVTKQLIDPLIVTEGGCQPCTYLSKVLESKYPKVPTGNHIYSQVLISTSKHTSNH